MIHSLAGGELQTDVVFDIAKVVILPDNVIGYYICESKGIKEKDFVLVPYGLLDNLVKGQVLRIDRNVNSKNFPISYNKLKKVYKKL